MDFGAGSFGARLLSTRVYAYPRVAASAAGGMISSPKRFTGARFVRTGPMLAPPGLFVHQGPLNEG
ncbi:MAG: hypothetical protein B7X53_01665 [Hyphomonas sp. 34-62-18]|nr:MAG: hypothetical protein B7X53_01665 [Hyphomonas sp. 34-62-18]